MSSYLIIIEENLLSYINKINEMSSYLIITVSKSML